MGDGREIELTEERRMLLLAAASAASAATTDMVECARLREINPVGNVGSGEVLENLVDAVRLAIEATGTSEGNGELYRALWKWLEEQP